MIWPPQLSRAICPSVHLPPSYHLVWSGLVVFLLFASPLLLQVVVRPKEVVPNTVSILSAVGVGAAIIGGMVGGGASASSAVSTTTGVSITVRKRFLGFPSGVRFSRSVLCKSLVPCPHFEAFFL